MSLVSGRFNSISSANPFSIKFAEMDVTVAGEISSARAKSTRAMVPCARRASNTRRLNECVLWLALEDGIGPHPWVAIWLVVA